VAFQGSNSARFFRKFIPNYALGFLLFPALFLGTGAVSVLYISNGRAVVELLDFL